jgi:O-antigen/teichoic acid export membrane protein
LCCLAINNGEKLATKSALIKNTIAGSVGHVSNIAFRLVQVPFFLSCLGVEEYGRWLLIYSIPSLLLIANVGFGAASANNIAMEVAAGKNGEAIKNYSTGLTLIAMVCGFVIVIAAISSYMFPWIHFLKTDASRGPELALAALLLTGSVLVTFPCDLYVGCFRAARKAHVALHLSSGRSWLELTFVVIAARFSSSFSIIALAVLASSLVYLFVYAVWSRRVLSEVHFQWTAVDWKKLPALLRNGMGFQGMAIGNALMLQGNLIAVQSTLGPASVVMFGTARTLVGAVLQAMGMINNITWSEFSVLLGSGNLEKAARLHRITAAISVAIGVCGAIFMMFFGVWLYELWTGSRISIPFGLMLLFILPIPVTSVYISSGVIHTACNQHEGMAYRYLIGTLISVVACFFLSKIFGIYGAAASVVIVNLVLAKYVVYRALEIVHDTPAGFLRGAYLESKNFFLVLTKSSFRKV